MRSPGRHRPRERNRGEPGVSGPRKAAARRLPSAWRDSPCASPGRWSRPAGRGETPQCVAREQSHAYEQQYDGCRQHLAIRLAHHPGDAAARPSAARRLSAWRTSSLKSDESSSAATAGSFVRSGLRIVRAMQPSREPGDTPEAVAKGKLAPARSECWSVAEALVSPGTAQEAKPIAGELARYPPEVGTVRGATPRGNGDVKPAVRSPPRHARPRRPSCARAVPGASCQVLAQRGDRNRPQATSVRG